MDQLKKYEAMLENKNTMLDLYKKEDVKKEEEEEAKETVYAYDIMKEKTKIAKEGATKYCPKCPKESVWCKHRKDRKEPKGVLAAPSTASQELGWREPIDTFNFNNQKSGMCKRTFYDHGHLS